MKYVQTNFKTNYVRCYTVYYRLVVDFARKYILNYELAEEIGQEVFLKLYERRIELNPDHPCTKNFLITMAKNLSIDYIRKERRKREKMEDVSYEDVKLDQLFYDDLEDSYISGEIISTINDTVDSYSESKKAVFINKVYLNKNRSEMAAKLETTVYKVKKIEEEINSDFEEELKYYFE